jgi:hypothetical protein
MTTWDVHDSDVPGHSQVDHDANLKELVTDHHTACNK